jgi:tetratricopeptide (TPR) repeat protein
VKRAAILFVLCAPRAWAAQPAKPAASTGGKTAAQDRSGAAARPAAAASGMDLGLDRLERDEPEEAAAAFLGAMTGLNAGDPRQERARFHLGRALRQIGLVVLADELLASVIESRTLPELVPLALVLLLEDLEAGHADPEFVESVLVDLDVGTLAGAQADAVTFHQGVADLRQGRPQWAEAGFRTIRDPGFRRRADLALGAWHLSTGDVETARQTFTAVADAADAPPAARSLATLSLARLAAEPGFAAQDGAALEAARRLYDRVQRPHSVSSEVLLERAWLEYHLGDGRRALGYLLALDAPDHRDRLLPDKYVLRALIYGQACHYAAARRAAQRLPRDFAAVAEALRRRASSSDGALRRVLSREPEVAPAEALAARVRAESEKAAALDDAKLAAWARKHYERALADADRRLTAARDTALPALGRQLMDAMADLKVVEFELALKLHRRVRGDAVARSERLGAAPEIPLGGDRVFFPFDGEYWADEIADLVVVLEDLCVE